MILINAYDNLHVQLYNDIRKHDIAHINADFHSERCYKLVLYTCDERILRKKQAQT